MYTVKGIDRFLVILHKRPTEVPLSLSELKFQTIEAALMAIQCRSESREHEGGVGGEEVVPGPQGLNE